MSQSTPLDKLDSPGAANDAGLVNKILADMNGGGGSAGPNEAMFQQQPMRMVLSEPPINSMQDRVMDPAPATAHMIGNSSPSAQDFSSMMGASSYVQVPQAPTAQIQMPLQKKGDMFSNLLDRLKAPLVVAALFFLLNLPFFHTSIMAYAPWAFRSGSELSMVGLVMISVLAGSLFGGYQLLSDIIG